MRSTFPRVIGIATVVAILGLLASFGLVAAG